MKKTICRVDYDTEAAAVVHKHIVGNFGDPAGYEEILFQMPEKVNISLASDNIYARSAIKNGAKYLTAASASPDGE